MDAEQVRAEIKQTRASIDRKLDLLSSRTSELAGAAKDSVWCALAVSLVVVGAAVVWSWARRHA